MASSIYQGFREYKREYDKKSHVFTNPEKRNTPQNTDVAVSASEDSTKSNDVEYRVQFLTASKQYGNKASIFKGLSPVDYYREGSLVKYTYGATSDPNEIKKILQIVQQKFNDAFIIEFKDGKRIK